MPKDMRISAGTPAVWEVYLDCQVSKQVGRFGCRDENWSHQPQGRSDLFCYCDFYDGYDALWAAGKSGGYRVPITLSITMSQSEWDRFQEDQTQLLLRSAALLYSFHPFRCLVCQSGLKDLQ
jgi:hypothetical protein